MIPAPPIREKHKYSSSGFKPSFSFNLFSSSIVSFFKLLISLLNCFTCRRYPGNRLLGPQSGCQLTDGCDGALSRSCRGERVEDGIPPAFHHLVANLATVIGQMGNGGAAVALHQFKGTLLYLGLLCEIAGLQRVTHLLQFRIEQTPTWVDHIAHPVAHPIGALVAEGVSIGLGVIIAMRHTCRPPCHCRRCPTISRRPPRAA